MSDALLKLMAPYVNWPPAAADIESNDAWVKLGAVVWNATLQAKTSSELHERLRQIANNRHVSASGEALVLLEKIAARKLRMFPDDHRQVGNVRVWADNGMARIEAMTFAHLR